ncbi:hypothetical protein [Streptomyces sp. NBC_01235]|uniref:hypothetical protein n=1 Tax=Streptomyces sp. NBC_01235 TaxID=2903788 RepID=UPI002E1625E1|nr:hypothetical protein OG289_05260 [Streptomyces sp. NBC_01235]
MGHQRDVPQRRAQVGGLRMVGGPQGPDGGGGPDVLLVGRRHRLQGTPARPPRGDHQVVPAGPRLLHLPGGRVRILTQETQIGRPAAAPADERPNPRLNGHQAWLDGPVAAASK